MGLNGISWDLVGFNGIWWDLMGFDGIIMQLIHEIYPLVIQHFANLNMAQSKVR